jgi:hypothetical protein
MSDTVLVAIIPAAIAAASSIIVAFLNRPKKK